MCTFSQVKTRETKSCSDLVCQCKVLHSSQNMQQYWGRGGALHTKGVRMRVGDFELNP